MFDEDDPPPLEKDNSESSSMGNGRRGSQLSELDHEIRQIEARMKNDADSRRFGVIPEVSTPRDGSRKSGSFSSQARRKKTGIRGDRKTTRQSPRSPQMHWSESGTLKRGALVADESRRNSLMESLGWLAEGDEAKDQSSTRRQRFDSIRSEKFDLMADEDSGSAAPVSSTTQTAHQTSTGTLQMDGGINSGINSLINSRRQTLEARDAEGMREEKESHDPQRLGIDEDGGGEGIVQAQAENERLWNTNKTLLTSVKIMRKQMGRLEQENVSLTMCVRDKAEKLEETEKRVKKLITEVDSEKKKILDIQDSYDSKITDIQKEAKSAQSQLQVIKLENSKLLKDNKQLTLNAIEVENRLSVMGARKTPSRKSAVRRKSRTSMRPSRTSTANHFSKSMQSLDTLSVGDAGGSALVEALQAENRRLAEENERTKEQLEAMSQSLEESQRVMVALQEQVRTVADQNFEHELELSALQSPSGDRKTEKGDGLEFLPDGSDPNLMAMKGSSSNLSNNSNDAPSANEDLTLADDKGMDDEARRKALVMKKRETALLMKQAELQAREQSLMEENKRLLKEIEDRKSREEELKEELKSAQNTPKTDNPLNPPGTAGEGGAWGGGGAKSPEERDKRTTPHPKASSPVFKPNDKAALHVAEDGRSIGKHRRRPSHLAMEAAQVVSEQGTPKSDTKGHSDLAEETAGKSKNGDDWKVTNSCFTMKLPKQNDSNCFGSLSGCMNRCKGKRRSRRSWTTDTENAFWEDFNPEDHTRASYEEMARKFLAEKQRGHGKRDSEVGSGDRTEEEEEEEEYQHLPADPTALKAYLSAEDELDDDQEESEQHHEPVIVQEAHV